MKKCFFCGLNITRHDTTESLNGGRHIAHRECYREHQRKLKAKNKEESKHRSKPKKTKVLKKETVIDVPDIVQGTSNELKS